MAAVSDCRTYLIGVHLINRDGRLIAEASDGHRATMIDAGSCADHVDVIVPYHAALAMKGAEGPLTVTKERETRVDVNLGDVTARAIDGRYPDMMRIIPGDAAHLVTLPAKELAGVVKRLRPHSNKKYHGLVFNFSPDSIKVETCNENLQWASETMAADCSIEAKIGLNADYMLDALKGLTTARVMVSAKRPHDSTVQIIDGATVNFVMPMHL
jgi:DNA polymerase III sliding clamp (beta) subunit (PCNA family)